jgi:hypothetical protein
MDNKEAGDSSSESGEMREGIGEKRRTSRDDACARRSRSIGRNGVEEAGGAVTGRSRSGRGSGRGRGGLGDVDKLRVVVDAGAARTKEEGRKRTSVLADKGNAWR